MREHILQSSARITSQLRATSQMMSASVQQGTEMVGALAESSELVTDLEREFRDFSGTSSRSRNLVSLLQRRLLTDKMLLILGLAIFTSTVLYIILRRVI